MFCQNLFEERKGAFPVITDLLLEKEWLKLQINRYFCHVRQILFLQVKQIKMVTVVCLV